MIYTIRPILGTLLLSLGLSAIAQSQQTIARQQKTTAPIDGPAERQYLVATLIRIADPVLTSLSKGELHKKMPIEAGNVEQRKYSTHLEAIGRLLAGMAPWLELGPDNTPEGQLREKYIDLAVAG